MRLFIRVAAGLALSVFLGLLSLLAALLVLPRGMPAWALELPPAGKAAALAVSLVLLFFVVFLSPSFRGAASSMQKNEGGLAQEPPPQSAEDGDSKRAMAAAPPSGHGAGAAPSADFVAQAVSRAAEQAVVSLVPQSAMAASAAAELSGRYVCRLSGGFECLMPSGGEEIDAASPSPVTSRDGVFVIDSEVASSIEGNVEIDRDFKSLVDSVLA